MAEKSVTESRRLPVSKEKTINLTMAEKSVTESRRLPVSKEKIINLNLTEMKEVKKTCGNAALNSVWTIPLS
jgi:hypothetical protein